jgi:hypothetical protein
MFKKGDRVSYLGISALCGSITDLWIAENFSEPEMMALVKYDCSAGAVMVPVRSLRKSVSLGSRTFTLFQREEVHV